MSLCHIKKDTSAKRNACALDFREHKKNKHDETMQFSEILAQMPCRSFLADHFSSSKALPLDDLLGTVLAYDQNSSEYFYHIFVETRDDKACMSVCLILKI